VDLADTQDHRVRVVSQDTQVHLDLVDILLLLVSPDILVHKVHLVSLVILVHLDLVDTMVHKV
jgi:hypothetical protein